MESVEDTEHLDPSAATAMTELLLASGAECLERSREMIAELDAAISRSTPTLAPDAEMTLEPGASGTA